MVTFREINRQIEEGTVRDNPNVTAVDEPGAGGEDVAEIWFEGPVDSSSPVIVDGDVTEVEAPAVLVIPNLSDKLPEILRCFYPEEQSYAGVSEKASVADDFSSGELVEIEAFTDIGPGVKVGNRVKVGPGVTIGGPAEIGDRVEIGSGVRIVSPVEIGEGTVIHANTVIGSDGYGYEQTGEEHEKIPQLGCVEIGRNVEIGAGSTVDRATFGSTVIGEGTKLDNHVHVAHNCTIGKNCLLVAKSALAGSVTLGDNVILAGEAGVGEHNTLADDVVVAGNAGVTKDIEEEGAVVSGFPARDHRTELKIKAALRKLPRLRKDRRKIKSRLKKRGEWSDDD